MGGYAPHTPEIVVIRFHLGWVRRSLVGTLPDVRQDLSSTDPKELQ